MLLSLAIGDGNLSITIIESPIREHLKRPYRGKIPKNGMYS